MAIGIGRLSYISDLIWITLKAAYRMARFLGTSESLRKVRTQLPLAVIRKILNTEQQLKQS